MSTALALAFLFAVGSFLGWILEFLFRNIFSHNGPRGKYFINPGFCKGPYLPIYGIGISVMFLISYIVDDLSKQPSPVLVILVIAVAMTLIEFLGGLFLLKVLHMRLWDYRGKWGNVMGLICPKFSLAWALIGAAYYLLVYPSSIGSLLWLADHLSFSFVIGLFFGFFIIDMCISARDAYIIKQFADDNEVIVKYEELKALMLEHYYANNQKKHFFNQVSNGENSLKDALKNNVEKLEKRVEDKKESLEQKAAKEKAELDRKLMEKKAKMDKKLAEKKAKLDKKVAQHKENIAEKTNENSAENGQGPKGE